MWRRRVLLGAGVAVVIAAVAVAAAAVAPQRSDPGYPWHSETMASVFGPNEEAGPSNAFISNAESAWDKDWRRHARYENRFFVAVPYARRSRTAGWRSRAGRAGERSGRTDRSRMWARATSAAMPRSAIRTMSLGRRDTIHRIPSA